MGAQMQEKLVKLRSLERIDLPFVHRLDNNASVMRYWFEEPYAAYVELEDLYDKHIHDQSERRLIFECAEQKIGLAELVEIDHIHRTAEFALIIAPEAQGHGFAGQSVNLVIEYAFGVLNLHKLFLEVDEDNKKAIHIYTRAGFKPEGRLVEQYFSNGSYRTVLRMAVFQKDYINKAAAVKK